jgi:HAD superfamily phosphatase (TIGR01668 family)
MKKLFEPYAYVNSIFDITPDMLKSKGILGLILDIDNTLVATNVRDAGEKVARYIKDLKENGIKAVIVSNGRKHRVEEFCRPLQIEYIYKAYKPLGRGFEKAIQIMDLPKDQIAVIGDQLFTDVLGGNLKGIRPILIKPIDPDEPIFVKFKRIFEKPFLHKKIYKDKL